ncbi:DNA primase [Aeromicrobium sp. PE09-221]|nr:DNA primase [Aeromicrobium sp. PE09-221]
MRSTATRYATLAAVFSRPVGQVSLPTAAQLLALGGIPIFPCVPGEKRPLTPRGFHDATTNLQQVKAWWRRHPTANLAIPTGGVSGLVVVDVDVHGSANGYRAFDRAKRAGLVPSWSFLVDTPSGGLHAYYPTVRGVVQRSWQAASSGVDFRGDGGYVLVPPSMITSKRGRATYQLHQVGIAAARPVDSDRLRDFLDPRPEPRPLSPSDMRQGADVSRLAAWVASRPEGERNRGLFWAACRLAENRIPAADALDVFIAAAGHAGLGEREVVATVRSAYRCTHPRPSSTPTPTPRTAGSMPSTAGGWMDERPAQRAFRGRGLSC